MSDDPISEPTRERFWSRSWRTWQVVLIAVVALVVGGAIGTATTEDADEVETAGGTTTSTTERPATTTTQRATTTTTAPTTTTAAVVTPERVQVAFDNLFQQMRADIIEATQSDNNVESVDKFVFNGGAGTVELAVTSRWASPDNQHDGAWTIMRGLAVFWSPDKGNWHHEVWVPSLTLENSGRRYHCPGDFMIALGDARAARSDWESVCA